MVGNNNAFISSRAGDITLSRSSAPKSKKPLLIVALLLVVAAVVVAVLLLTKPKTETRPELSTSEFNKYMNYIMTGSDESEWNSEKALSLTTSTAYKMFYAEDNGISKDDQKAYFAKASEDLSHLLKSFDISESDLAPTVSNYDGATVQSIDGYDKELTARFATNYDRLNAIRSFIGTDYINGDIMMAYFLSGDTAEMVQITVSSNFGEMDRADSESARQYVDYVEQIFTTVKEIYNLYRSASCISDAALLDNCLNSKQQEQATALFAVKNASEQALYSTERDFIVDYFNSARSIYNMLNEDGGEE